MGQITFIPVGGLANRMRAIASALTLAQRTNSNLDIVWYKDHALYASFYSLFEPISYNVSLRDASWLDSCLLDRPRKRNFYIPRLFQMIAFDDCLYERSFYSLVKNAFDFDNWVYGKNKVYMASYSVFQKYEPALISKLFVPIEKIRNDINSQSCLLAENVVGVHVRRGDNVQSIEQSPLQLFYERLDLEIDENVGTLIYLATDSEDVKVKMKKRYGNRVFFSRKEANRTSTDGIQNGLVEMYSLAKTKKIYGSFQSTFSEMASQISGVSLEILQR